MSWKNTLSWTFYPVHLCEFDQGTCLYPVIRSPNMCTIRASIIFLLSHISYCPTHRTGKHQITWLLRNTFSHNHLMFYSEHFDIFDIGINDLHNYQDTPCQVWLMIVKLHLQNVRKANWVSSEWHVEDFHRDSLKIWSDKHRGPFISLLINRFCNVR